MASITFHTCLFCQGTYSSAQTQDVCVVCTRGAHPTCTKKDFFHTLLFQGQIISVCQTCLKPVVTDRQIIETLLRLYQALPGADPHINYRSLKTIVAQTLASPFQLWQQQQKSL